MDDTNRYESGTLADRRAAGMAEAADEISLYDLWAVLARRRRVVWGVFFGITALGVAYATVKPPVYRYTTALELGDYTVKDPGDGVSHKRYLQTPEEVSHKLREVYIPNATGGPDREGEGIIEVEVEHEPGGELVLLRSRSSPDQAQDVEAVHRDVVERLLADHEELATREQQRRRLALARAQRNLEHIKDERVRTARLEPLEKKVAEAEQALKTLEEDHRIQKLTLENGIHAKQRELVSLEEEREYLGQEQARLETLGKLLKEQIADGERLTGILEQSQSGLEAAAKAASDAFGLLLVTVQLEQAERRLADLQERLAVKLPQQADKLMEQLAQNDRRHTTAEEKLEELKARLQHALTTYESRQAALQRELQAARTTLAKETAQYERDLGAARDGVAAARLSLDDVRPTTPLILAKPSARPVGAGTAVTTALAAILGLMMGVFMAFFVEFVARARDYGRNRDQSRGQNVGPEPPAEDGSDPGRMRPTLAGSSSPQKQPPPVSLGAR